MLICYIFTNGQNIDKIVKNRELIDEINFSINFVKHSFSFRNDIKLLSNGINSKKEYAPIIISVSGIYDIEHEKSFALNKINIKIINSKKTFLESSILFENRTIKKINNCTQKKNQGPKYNFAFFEVEPGILIIFNDLSEILNQKILKKLNATKIINQVDYEYKNNDYRNVEGIIDYEFLNNKLKLYEVVTNDNTSYIFLKYGFRLNNSYYRENCGLN